MKHIPLGSQTAADICPQNSNGTKSEYSRLIQNNPPYQRITLKILATVRTGDIRERIFQYFWMLFVKSAEVSRKQTATTVALLACFLL
jgi:hypothetical protein